MKTLNRTAGYLVAAALACLLAHTALASQVQMIRATPSSGVDQMTLSAQGHGSVFRAVFLGSRSTVGVTLAAGGDSQAFADVFGVSSSGALIAGCRVDLQGPGPKQQNPVSCTGVVARYIGLLTFN